MFASFSKNMIFKVSGNSMYPTLMDHDIVVVNECSEYDINDIIVINCKNFLIIHRVIQIKVMKDGEYYLTKGDNNNFIDRWHAKKEIIGKVVKINDFTV